MDLGFLEACTRYNVLPTFLGFKVSNSTLRNSEAYKKCQEKLLREEIYNKVYAQKETAGATITL